MTGNTRDRSFKESTLQNKLLKQNTVKSLLTKPTSVMTAVLPAIYSTSFKKVHKLLHQGSTVTLVVNVVIHSAA